MTVDYGPMESVQSWKDEKLLPQMKYWTESPWVREKVKEKYLAVLVSGTKNTSISSISNDTARLTDVKKLMNAFCMVS